MAMTQISAVFVLGLTTVCGTDEKQRDQAVRARSGFDPGRMLYSVSVIVLSKKGVLLVYKISQLLDQSKYIMGKMVYAKNLFKKSNKMLKFAGKYVIVTLRQPKKLTRRFTITDDGCTLHRK
ncbi:hypothetical protein NQ317_011815 [Molorchus minor]|uniref:Uncharacterized protein n=1 Tax=Molorchus minor TaxID=1323400 RepID=A0ABQ9J6P2_9CUCU|nr:hypothetical protein NQ317_011815 [Molorchus minor]